MMISKEEKINRNDQLKQKNVVRKKKNKNYKNSSKRKNVRFKFDYYY